MTHLSSLGVFGIFVLFVISYFVLLLLLLLLLSPVHSCVFALIVSTLFNFFILHDFLFLVLRVPHIVDVIFFFLVLVA